MCKRDTSKEKRFVKGSGRPEWCSLTKKPGNANIWLISTNSCKGRISKFIQVREKISWNFLATKGVAKRPSNVKVLMGDKIYLTAIVFLAIRKINDNVTKRYRYYEKKAFKPTTLL